MLQKGFTLVELMIVVAIIVILAGWGYPQYLEHTAAAKMTIIATTIINSTNVNPFCSMFDIP